MNGPVCWVCRSSNVVAWKTERVQHHVTPEDFKVTDSRYGFTLPLSKCLECGFIFAEHDRLNCITTCYEELTDSDYQKSQNSRALQMKYLLDRARQAYPTAASVLDIGAGTGLLVKEAKRQGLEAIGIEPCRFFVDTALTENGVELLHGSLPQPLLVGRHFDLIFLIDVIEHVVDPVSLLKQCRTLLSSNGLVAVVTPDVSSFMARLLKQKWWHFRIAHVGYFNRRSLASAAAAAGFSISTWFRPKWFFRVEYLAVRLACYLPISGVNRLAMKIYPLRRLYDRVIPFNLFDSLAVFLSADIK